MFLRCSQIFNLALASLSYGTPAVPALASGHPRPGGDPPQPPLDASSAEITTINQQQQPPRAHCTYNDRRLEGTSHPQHVSLPPSCGQPQRLSSSVMEHTLNVLATIIEKNPAFLVALNQLVAQFMPPPQPESSPPPQTRQHIPRLRCSSRSRNERSRSPRSAPRQTTRCLLKVTGKSKMATIPLRPTCRHKMAAGPRKERPKTARRGVMAAHLQNTGWNSPACGMLKI